MKPLPLIGVIYAGALCGALLAYGGVRLVAEEGVILPPTTHPAEVAARPAGRCYRPETQRWEACGPSKRWIALAWLGQGLDLVSTEIVLSRGGVELNPLMKARAVRWTVKPLLTVGTTWGLSRMPRSLANGVAKSAFWTGLVPGAANAVQGVAR